MIINYERAFRWKAHKLCHSNCRSHQHSNWQYYPKYLIERKLIRTEEYSSGRSIIPTPSGHHSFPHALPNLSTLQILVTSLGSRTLHHETPYNKPLMYELSSTVCSPHWAILHVMVDFDVDSDCLIRFRHCVTCSSLDTNLLRKVIYA